jgi:DNA polymerase (family 10)
MKFSELKLLFSEEVEKVKEKKLSQGRYILIAYNNVLREIGDVYTDNEYVSEKRINELDITDHMKEKLINLSKKSVPKYLREKEKTHKLKEDLDKLLGIGSKKANELITDGLTNIRQLKSKKWFDRLNTDTQIILEHNPLRQVHWEDIHKIEEKIVGFRKDVVIVGSYRRKKPIVRDIDILFISKEKNDIQDYLSYLKKKFYNKIWIYANGEFKISTIIQPYRNNPDLKYKADIFICTKDNYYSTLLYSTGSKDHNIKMRAIARRKGYLLNQDGIFDLKTKKKINKSEDGEKKLFEILGMNYVAPDKRF